MKFLPPFCWDPEQSNKDLVAEALLQASMLSPDKRLNMAWLEVEVGEVWA